MNRLSEPEPEISELAEAQCPKCDSEEVEKIDHPRLPPAHRGRCTACDHRASPLAFHEHWEWEHMTEEEREQARAARERAMDEMAEWQHSAAYISGQREP